jgi:hypothetical protein
LLSTSAYVQQDKFKEWDEIAGLIEDGTIKRSTLEKVFLKYITTF